MNLEKKDPKHFSDDLKKVLDIITTKRGVYPVGSFSYKVHKYPSDIDIFEYIEYCCDIKSVKYRLASKFKQMAEEIIKDDNQVFLSDFKAGFDRRFFYLKNFKNKDILEKTIEKDELLSISQKKDLIKLLNENNKTEYKEYVRLLYTIRWNLKEILKGEKKLVGGKIMKLSDALVDKSDVKIDLIGEVDGDFKEISNYFYINLRNEKGIIRNLTKKPENRIESLDKDLLKYSVFPKMNSLKFAKRLWLKSILLKKYDMVKKLNPLFSSDAAIMNQVKSEIEAIFILFDKHKLNKKTLESIILQIEGFKNRLSYVKNDLDAVYKKLDSIIDLVKQVINEKSDFSKKILKKMGKIISILSKYTEEQSQAFLKENGIKYKREKRSYDEYPQKMYKSIIY